MRSLKPKTKKLGVEELRKRLKEYEGRIAVLKERQKFTLTPREHDIARAYVLHYIRKGTWGDTDNHAKTLGITNVTVWNHVQRMVQKGAMRITDLRKSKYAVSDECLKIPHVLKHEDMDELWASTPAVTYIEKLIREGDAINHEQEPECPPSPESPPS